jgi:hypothetical protein
MARRLYPLNDNLIGVPSTGLIAGTAALLPHGQALELWADEAGTIVADCTDLLGNPITQVVVNGVTIPEFLGPDDITVDRLFARKAGTAGATFALRPVPWTYDELTDFVGARSGGSMAFAANESGVATAFAVTATAIPGVTITIPPTIADVTIKWGAHLGLGTAGQGVGYTLLYESTGGGAVLKDSRITHCRDAAYPVTNAWASHDGEFRAGPSTLTRSWALFGQTVREAGSGLVVNSRNLLGGGKSWIRAIAE